MTERQDFSPEKGQRLALVGEQMTRLRIRKIFPYISITPQPLYFVSSRWGIMTKPHEEEIVVTEEMIEAGVSELFRHDFMTCDDSIIRKAVEQVYRTMILVQPKSSALTQ